MRTVIRKIGHTSDYMYLPMPPISGQRPATEVWLIFIDTELGKQRIWYWYCLFPVSCPFSSSEIREKDLMKLCLLQVHAKKNTVKVNMYIPGIIWLNMFLLLSSMFHALICQLVLICVCDVFPLLVIMFHPAVHYYLWSGVTPSVQHCKVVRKQRLSHLATM